MSSGRGRSPCDTGRRERRLDVICPGTLAAASRRNDGSGGRRKPTPRHLFRHGRRPDCRTVRLTLRDRVTIILVMFDVLPLAEVKAKFSEMVDRVEQQHDRITVTRNGRPAAVLMSADDLAALEDTLELLSDPTAMAEIDQPAARWWRATSCGRTVRAKYLRQ